MKAQEVRRPRDILWSFIREHLNGSDVSISDICAEAEREFNAEFFEDLGREELKRIVYFCVQSTLSPTNATRALLHSKGKNVSSIFARWYEEVEENRKVNILNMTNSDLQVAAHIRLLRADGEQRRASFLRTLAERLKGGETVGSKWHMEEIADLYKSKMTETTQPKST